MISTVVNNENFQNRRSLPDLGLFMKSNVDERLYMFARRQSNRLSSTLEQRLRNFSALVVNFFLSAVYMSRKFGENDDVF